MRVSEFKFNESFVKLDFFRENNIYQKINHALGYLQNHLPVNKLNSDNTFDFNELDFDEGKNYNWFFLVNDNVTMLVRAYRSHFTFFVNRKDTIEGEAKHYNFCSHTSVFTICDNRDKMPDNLSDELIDNPFKSISSYLPKLVEAIDNGKVGMIWNPYYLGIEDYTEVKIGFNGKEQVSSLDTVIFACDEIFNMYICKYAENDTLKYISKFKEGDMFGETYLITKVKTDPNNCGLELKNTNFEDSKPKWCDIYSLTQYHADDLNYDENLLIQKAKDFMELNHYEIINSIEDEPYLYIWITTKYIDLMYEKYEKEKGVFNKSYFRSAIDDNFEYFIKKTWKLKVK